MAGSAGRIGCPIVPIPALSGRRGLQRPGITGGRANIYGVRLGYSCYNSLVFKMGFGPVFYLWAKVMDVTRLVEDTLAGLGYELVDLEISGRGMVRVFIDKPEGDMSGGIGLEDCERVSNQLTRLFTVEGVAYDRLEVSSPGLDRPLRKEADFVLFRGQKASLKLRMPLDGRKNFIGILGEVKDGVLQLDMEGKQVAIALSNVDRARLVPVF